MAAILSQPHCVQAPKTKQSQSKSWVYFKGYTVQWQPELLESSDIWGDYYNLTVRKI